MKLKTTLFTALATVMALNAAMPAFANTTSGDYEADDFKIVYSNKSYDFVKARYVRHIEKIKVCDSVYDVKKTSKNHTAKFSDNAFDAGIDLSIREILAEGLNLAQDTNSEITRVNIHGSKDNEKRSSAERISRGGVKEEVEFSAHKGSAVKFIYHDGEDLKKSIGFDTIRRHYFSDYLQDVINLVYHDKTSTSDADVEEIVEAIEIGEEL